MPYRYLAFEKVSSSVAFDLFASWSPISAGVSTTVCALCCLAASITQLDASRYSNSIKYETITLPLGASSVQYIFIFKA
jgi:hypothetical protein